MTHEKLRFTDNDLIENRYRIYNGDCIEVLKKIPKKSVDLIFADPPYNLQLKNELCRPNQTKVEGVDDQWHKSNPMPNFRGVRFTNATETMIWAKKSETQKNILSITM